MAVKLETGFAALESTAASTAASAQTATSSEGLELVRLSTSLDGLQAKMIKWTEKAQAQVDAMVARAEEIATGVSMVQQEAQMQFQVVNGKLSELYSSYQSSGPAAPPAPQAQPAVDPMAHGNDGWSFSLGKGGGPQRVSIATPPTSDPPRVNGRWALYDEKYIMLPGLTSNKFDAKSPQTWLQLTRDYIAGRTSELDPLLDWVEAQIEPISLDMLLHQPRGQTIPMVDAAGSLIEVARHL